MAQQYFRHEPLPDHPGWYSWDILDESRFNQVLGPLRIRRESEAVARLRMVPNALHANLADGIHGGVILSLIDIALFAGPEMCGVNAAGGGATIDLSTQFLRPGRLDAPIDVVVELLRETGRMLFSRGLVEQAGETIAAFSGTTRKPTVR